MAGGWPNSCIPVSAIVVRHLRPHRCLRENKEITMRRLVIAILVLAAHSYGSNVDACDCLAQGAPCAAVWDSDVVFIGRAAADASDRVIRFTVERRVRGVDTDEVDVTNPL